MPRRHVVITGTGRAGTTFLVQLLTNLGLETGYTPDNMLLDEFSRAGLEHDIRREDAPYIVKSPRFCDYAEEVLSRDDILIDHVFIPVRELQAAAESRRYAHRRVVSKAPLLWRLVNKVQPLEGVRGGLLRINHQLAHGLIHRLRPLLSLEREQENILLQQIYKLALALSRTPLPVTLLHYPTLVKDSLYLYRKLQPILGTVTYSQFQSAFAGIIRPDWVHSFNENDL